MTAGHLLRDMDVRKHQGLVYSAMVQARLADERSPSFSKSDKFDTRMEDITHGSNACVCVWVFVINFV